MHQLRILSLSPTGKHLGYAFLEGAHLIDWGIRGFGRGQANYRVATQRLDVVEALVDRYEPHVVVLPAMTTRRLPRTRFVRAIQSLLQAESASVELCSTETVEMCFATLTEPKRPTQHAVMTAVTELFPELEPLLPRPRRLWDSRDYWTPMFDAVARAVGWIHEAIQRGQSLF